MVSTGFPGDSDPRDEEQDPELCEFCDESMEWEDDAEYDPDLGRVVRSGGSFCCTNKNCAGKLEAEEDEE
jgi:hypothetical protein